MLWLDIPEQPDRALDAEDPFRPLEGFSESIQPLFEEILGFGIDFEHLRDPDDIRTKFQDVISGLTIATVAVEETGRTSRVEFTDSDPNDPLVPLGRTSIGWILTDSDDKEFTVNQVHKLSTAVIIKGNVLPATGAATLRPPALIGLLGADYGITVDQHDPEQYQRSSVRNAWQWLAVKGTDLGYDIVAKIAGYRAVALPLYRISAGWAATLPPDEVFELPASSGIFYTPTSPTQALFDEVAADIIPTDVFCYQDRGDGVTWGEQIGETMQGLTINATTDLGGGLWRVEVDGGADLTPIASAGLVDESHFAPWYASFPGGDTGRFWLEDDPVDIGGGSWIFEVMAGVAPTFGALANLDYDCRIQTSCDYCRASAIRLEIRPEEITSDPDVLLSNVLERMVRKLLQAVPIHVRVVDLVHIIGPIDADVHVAGSHIIAQVAGIQVVVPVSASIGYHYDIVEADVIQVDPPHMVADVAGDLFEGIGDTIGGVAPNMTLTDAGGQFNSKMVGKALTVSGATTGANDGTFTITGFTSSTVIGYSNAGGVAEAFPGTWSVDVA